MLDLAEASTWKPNSRSYAKFFSDATARLPPVSHHHNMLSEAYKKPSGSLRPERLHATLAVILLPFL